jgi:type II secretory pathway component PulF
MEFIQDKRGLASALVYAMFVIIVMAVLYMCLGTGVSLVVEMANQFATEGMIAPVILNTINWIFHFWAWFPVLVLVCVGLYIIRRSIRRGVGSGEDEF